MSTLNVENLSDGTDSVPIGDVINGSARAWVNFDGTGTVAIRDSYNVSSITDNGTGNYTPLFITNMPDANYAIAGTMNSSNPSIQTSALATTGFNIVTRNSAFAAADFDKISAIVHGN